MADWIYASTDKVHCLVFGLPGQRRLPPLARVPDGVRRRRVAVRAARARSRSRTPRRARWSASRAGGSVFFRKDTWHHAFACDGKPLKVRRVLRAAAVHGLVGRLRADAAVPGGVAVRRRRAARQPRCRARRGRGRCIPCARRDLVWRRDLGALVGLACSTEHLTAGHLEVQAGETAVTARARRRRGAVRHRRACCTCGPGTATRRACSSCAATTPAIVPAGRAPRVPQLRRRDGARGVRRGTLLRVRVLGIDVGGTKLAAGIVDVATGEVTERRMWPTEPERGPDAVLADLVRCAAELAPDRIGLGRLRARRPAPAGRPARTRSTGATASWPTRSRCRARSSPTCARRRSPSRASAPAAAVRASST